MCSILFVKRRAAVFCVPFCARGFANKDAGEVLQEDDCVFAGFTELPQFARKIYGEKSALLKTRHKHVTDGISESHEDGCCGGIKYRFMSRA